MCRFRINIFEPLHSNRFTKRKLKNGKNAIWSTRKSNPKLISMKIVHIWWKKIFFLLKLKWKRKIKKKKQQEEEQIKYNYWNISMFMDLLSNWIIPFFVYKSMEKIIFFILVFFNVLTPLTCLCVWKRVRSKIFHKRN